MMDKLVTKMAGLFGGIKDHRRPGRNSTYKLRDSLCAAFAMFSLKDPSLLSFREAYPHRDQNLKRLYHIENIPGDTAMRESLDGIGPGDIQALFPPFMEELRSQGILTDRQVKGGYITVSIDGTEHFCSSKNSCAHCMEKQLRGGEKKYYHQLLAAVLVHPGHRTVFPIAAEAIVKQDGSQKNDCELNAAKRLIPVVRQTLPDEKLLLSFDALYGNGPLIKLLARERMHFITVVKEGLVLAQADRLREKGELQLCTWKEGGEEHRAYFANGLMLNGQHQDIKVNYIAYESSGKPGGKGYRNSWVTDVHIGPDNVSDIVAAGRARWKIENETFNTLKNQGYHLEHNYGHGKKYLSTNFALLAILAFLIDQIAQAKDCAMKKAMGRYRTKKAFWQRVREVSNVLPVKTFNALYRYISGEIDIDFPLLE